jgi:hypothetical protein
MGVESGSSQDRTLLDLRWQQARLVRPVKQNKELPANNVRSGADMKNEMSFKVDLDNERGRPARPSAPNIHHVSIRKTGAVNLAALEAYLKGTMSFDNSILEAISKSYIPDICVIARSSLI